MLFYIYTHAVLELHLRETNLLSIKGTIDKNKTKLKLVKNNYHKIKMYIYLLQKLSFLQLSKYKLVTYKRVNIQLSDIH